MKAIFLSLIAILFVQSSYADSGCVTFTDQDVEKEYIEKVRVCYEDGEAKTFYITFRGDDSEVKESVAAFQIDNPKLYEIHSMVSANYFVQIDIKDESLVIQDEVTGDGSFLDLQK